MAAKPGHARLPSTLKGVVWTLRVLGLFCFKMSSSASEVELSLPLLLWTLFWKTFHVFQTISFVSWLLYFFKMGDVGSLSRNLSTVVSLVYSLTIEMVLIIKGPALCRLLSECEETGDQREKRISRSVTAFSLEAVMTLLYYCSYAVLASASVYYMWSYQVAFLIERLCTILRIISNYIGLMLIPILFREVLAVTCTELSVDFLLDENFLRGDVVGPNRRLDSLERTIHRVSNLCKTQCLFTLIFHSNCFF